VLADRRLADAARLRVFGDARVLAQGAPRRGVRVTEVDLVDLRNWDPSRVARGAVSADSGRVAGETLKHMIERAAAGRDRRDHLAPLNKAALHAGGWKFNDEHQMFAHLTRHRASSAR
jgi:4-hydroxythreonine-4-phosphate dehydrogenase